MKKKRQGQIGKESVWVILNSRHCLLVAIPNQAFNHLFVQNSSGYNYVLQVRAKSVSPVDWADL